MVANKKELNAFVLMPFDKDFNDVYQLGIKEAALSSGIIAQRLDEQIFDGNMLQKIYQEIDNADIVIADMSNRNPNVFYEVGYADARKKLIILMTNNKNDIPFDLLHRPHIIYDGSITKLKEELVVRLEWAKEEIIKRKTNPIISKLKIINSFVDRNEYSDSVVIEASLELHNVSNRVIKDIHSIYLYVGRDWSIKCDGKNCMSTKSEMDKFKYRHIIHPEFSSITSRDWLPVNFEMKKIFFATWIDEGEDRDDVYEIDGTIRIQVNADSDSFITEEYLNVKAEYFDAPF